MCSRQAHFLKKIRNEGRALCLQEMQAHGGREDRVKVLFGFSFEAEQDFDFLQTVADGVLVAVKVLCSARQIAAAAYELQSGFKVFRFCQKGLQDGGSVALHGIAVSLRNQKTVGADLVVGCKATRLSCGGEISLIAFAEAEIQILIRQMNVAAADAKRRFIVMQKIQKLRENDFKGLRFWLMGGQQGKESTFIQAEQGFVVEITIEVKVFKTACRVLIEGIAFRCVVDFDIDAHNVCFKGKRKAFGEQGDLRFCEVICEHAADIAFCQEVGIVGANGVHDFIDNIFKISIAAKTEKRKRVRVAESKHILWKFVENYSFVGQTRDAGFVKLLHGGQQQLRPAFGEQQAGEDQTVRFKCSLTGEVDIRTKFIVADAGRNDITGQPLLTGMQPEAAQTLQLQNIFYGERHRKPPNCDVFMVRLARKRDRTGILPNC